MSSRLVRRDKSKNVPGAPVTSFLQTAENTTQDKQYSKALQKRLMQKRLKFKYCKTVHIIIPEPTARSGEGY